MKAILLAAGKGERMRPLTDHTPKPLLIAGGKPLIVHQIEKLVAAGITEIVINSARLGHLFPATLGDGTSFGATLHYSGEGEEALETGGGIFKSLAILGAAPFLAVNADVWTDYPYARLLTLPLSGLAHLVLVNNPEHNQKGDFGLTDGRISRAEPRYTFSGIGIYQPALFADCQPGKFPLAPLLFGAADRGQATGEHYSGRWLDVGTSARLGALDDFLLGVTQDL